MTYRVLALVSGRRNGGRPDSPESSDFDRAGCLHGLQQGASRSTPQGHARRPAGNRSRMSPWTNGPTRYSKSPTMPWPIAPAGFKVELYAQGFTEPRLIRTAPNGDLVFG